MDVLVTGGTGFIGTALCRELDERGQDVTALSRSPTDDGLPSSVETVVGDVTDYDSIESALDGVDIVVNLVALSPLFKPSGGDEMHEAIHVRGTENVVRAAEKHDLDAVVQLSALGADPEGPTAYIRSKGRAEGIVRDADLEWTIFRPSVVFGEGGEFVRFTKMLTTPYVTALPGGGKTRFQPIYRGELVDMLATAVEDDSHRNEVYEIGGPEVLSLADVTELVYRAEGRSVSVFSVPMSLAGLGLSLADPLPFVPFGTDQIRSLRLDNVPANNDVDAFDRAESSLTSLGEFLGIEKTTPDDSTDRAD
ncbi:complex I NDUFA9 subunit family protein [Halanaeroarchaeum sulfurireducens]|uniref:NAD-dependent epimerase/dehydratase n=1 Tax=Halanaeroarchaeum sulfurireducens TaxID=1604004 RepID=A0A0F7PDY2_9EURY|nr:complex I NDUFA9 subunit family protein [Halanaeroarchaeum sulfurireducens]AKH98415.1 NAD-dependent epimerase/dehydratase [Halanaeroarchaeum sulfurireducens]ALG82809.1 NAD-dependent epimerase/dehydratase [Halanaeroarchaeum sulfurireducens]